MDGSGGYHPKWGNPITKEFTRYALTDKWILAQKLRIPKIQFAKHKKIKKKEDQRVDTSFLLRIGNKLPMEGVTETKFRAETEGMTILKLPDLWIHPINNHQTQILLQMPTRFCLQEPNTAESREALPVPGKYRNGCSQSSIEWNTGPPMEKLEETPKELKGSATL